MFLQEVSIKKIKEKMTNWIEYTSNWFSEHWEYIKVPLYGLFAFLNVDINVVHIIMWLMFIDTFSGVIKAMAVDKVKFTFKKFYIGIMSKFVLLLIPIMLALMALGIGYDFKWAVEATLRLIILSEGISFFTNVISIKDNKLIKNKDYLSVVLNWVRIKLTDLFNVTLNDPNPKDKKEK